MSLDSLLDANRQVVILVDAALAGSENARKVWRIMKKAVRERREYTLQEHQELEEAYRLFEAEEAGGALVDLRDV